MKYLSLLSLILMFSCISLLQAQEYTVDGQTYSLKAEVEGPLSLLWNTIDNNYRYFAKKADQIVELKNTKQNGAYQEEFKDVLKQMTLDASESTERIELTLPSLRKFFNEYNAQVDPNFSYEKPTIHLKTRLGGFIGMSNNAYFYNLDNTFIPAFGIDFELVDEVLIPRHSMVVQFRQLFKSSDYNFSSSQFSLNYRFKFIKSDRLDVFANFKFAAFTSISRDQKIEGDDFIKELTSGNKFQVPGALGLGVDYKLGNGYITFAYNDIVAIIDNNGEFPVECTLGYKFNL